MSVFNYTYSEIGNLIATIVQANTLTDLHAIYAANLKLYNASSEVRERYDQRWEEIMRQKQEHPAIVK